MEFNQLPSLYSSMPTEIILLILGQVLYTKLEVVQYATSEQNLVNSLIMLQEHLKKK